MNVSFPVGKRIPDAYKRVRTVSIWNYQLQAVTVSDDTSGCEKRKILVLIDNPVHLIMVVQNGTLLRRLLWSCRPKITHVTLIGKLKSLKVVFFIL